MTDKEFEVERCNNINLSSQDNSLKQYALDFMIKSAKYKYTYNFTWLGRPIIQFPQDIIAMQEIIWQVKPDLIIETGIAHGGSLIFYASMLEIPGNNGKILGIDIDIIDGTICDPLNKEDVQYKESIFPFFGKF